MLGRYTWITVFCFAFGTAYGSIPDRMTTLDLQQFVRPITVEGPGIADLTQIIPRNMSQGATDDIQAEQFKTELSQRLFDSFFNGKFFRNTAVGAVTTKVEQAVSPTIQVAPSGRGSQNKPQTMGFELKAIEKKATLTYDGILTTHVVYLMDPQIVQTSMSAPVASNTTLSFQYTTPVSGNDSTETVNLNYNW
jgi:hypothetical protein